MYRTANLQSCILYIYSTNIGTEYFKHGIYSPFFFSSKCSLFHNSNLFGFCIIHILYTVCAKIKKIIPAPKGLWTAVSYLVCTILFKCSFTSSGIYQTVYKQLYITWYTPYFYEQLYVAWYTLNSLWAAVYYTVYTKPFMSSCTWERQKINVSCKVGTWSKIQAACQSLAQTSVTTFRRTICCVHWSSFN